MSKTIRQVVCGIIAVLGSRCEGAELLRMRSEGRESDGVSTARGRGWQVVGIGAGYRGVWCCGMRGVGR